MHLPAFRPGVSARDAHQALRRSLDILDRSRQCAVLWFADIQARGLHRELGYATMRAYAMEELGFSSTRCGDFLRLAGQLNDLPELRGELAAGRIGYAKAREIIPVVDRQNEAAWLEVARTQPRQQVRAAVKQAKAAARCATGQPELVPQAAAVPAAAAVPVAVRFELSPGQYAEFEALLGRIGHRGSRAELLLEMARALADESVGGLADESADGLAGGSADESAGEPKIARRRATPPHQIHVHQCPDCGRVAAATPRGEVTLAAIDAETVACDAEIHAPGRRNAATIPPRIRREVLSRDRHACRRKGCANTRHLHVHHLVARSRGGGNEPDNLVTLCPACHRLWHERGGTMVDLLRPVPG